MCIFCFAGESAKTGKGQTRVYPQGKTSYPLRTMIQHLEDMEKVIETGESINGILGQTPLPILGKKIILATIKG